MNIHIDGLSTGYSRDHVYLKITYIARNKRRDLFISNEDLMYALFDAQIINGWDDKSVYYADIHYGVSTEGIITTTSPVYADKIEFIKNIDNDHAETLVKNQLLSL